MSSETAGEQNQDVVDLVDVHLNVLFNSSVFDHVVLEADGSSLDEIDERLATDMLEARERVASAQDDARYRLVELLVDPDQGADADSAIADFSRLQEQPSTSEMYQYWGILRLYHQKHPDLPLPPRLHDVVIELARQDEEQDILAEAMMMSTEIPEQRALTIDELENAIEFEAVIPEVLVEDIKQRVRVFQEHYEKVHTAFQASIDEIGELAKDSRDDAVDLIEDVAQIDEQIEEGALALLRRDIQDGNYRTNAGLSIAKRCHDAALAKELSDSTDDARRVLRSKDDNNNFITDEGWQAAQAQHDWRLLSRHGFRFLRLGDDVRKNLFTTPEGHAAASGLHDGDLLATELHDKGGLVAAIEGKYGFLTDGARSQACRVHDELVILENWDDLVALERFVDHGTLMSQWGRDEAIQRARDIRNRP